MSDLSEETAGAKQLVEKIRVLEGKIARRKERLVRAKLEWEQTFDAIGDPVAIVSEDYVVLRANRAYVEAAGPTGELRPGTRCHQALAGRSTPCAGCPLAGVFRREERKAPVDIAGRAGRTLQVSVFPVELPGDPAATPVMTQDLEDDFKLKAVCSYRDVTEERALQAQLQRNEKLAALGLFAGGVAHEINNPLGAILAFAQLLLKRGTHDEEKLNLALHEIEDGAQRCKRIIQSLQSFAHTRQLDGELIAVGALVQDAVRRFAKDYALSDRIALNTTIAANLPSLRGDPILLHQLMRNLLQNAEHALAEGGGRIDVSVRASAEEIEIAVRDDGAGIREEHLSRIYDPFFTTKPQGRGTGLGLSICYRIVEQHQGRIEVESTPGSGTCFRVMLPVRRSSW